MSAPIRIDGSAGEGGGQILRTSLALSILTGRPLDVHRIRARRKTPGLRNQHLTGVLAAAAICGGEVSGARVGAAEIAFRPGPLRPGEYVFTVPTAGSALLVLQTVLPPLLVFGGSYRLVLEGGTHNSMSPPFHFIAGAFLPLLRRMGARVTARLERYGFYPAGGGRVVVEVEPSNGLSPLRLLEAGAIRRREARILICRLPDHIAEREQKIIRTRLGWPESECHVERVEHSSGPGNVVMLTVECEHVTEVVTAFCERGARAQAVAAAAVDELETYLASGAPVGEHLADQLLIPLALAGGGSYRTVSLSPHSTTNMETIRRFLSVDFTVTREPGGAVRVDCRVV